MPSRKEAAGEFPLFPSSCVPVPGSDSGWWYPSGSETSLGHDGKCLQVVQAPQLALQVREEEEA